MFERVLNTPLHHLKTQTIFQAKRKVAYSKITTKTSAMKVVFSEGADRIWKFQKSFRHKLSDFQYWADLFPKKKKKMPAVNSF